MKKCYIQLPFAYLIILTRIVLAEQGLRLTVADCLTSRTSVFEASLRATLARIGTNFSVSGFGSSLDKSPAAAADENADLPLAGRAALDIAAIRLSHLPDKSKKLLTILEQVGFVVLILLQRTNSLPQLAWD